MTALKNARSRQSVATAPCAAPAPRYEADVVCLADVEPVVVPWLWPQRIPLGRITLISGRPGAGKTFLTADIAARVSTGAAWPDGSGNAPQGSVLLMNAEDDAADTLVPRLIAAKANLKRIHWVRGISIVEADGTRKTLALGLANLEQIRQKLLTMPDCRLLVLDPIGSYLGARTDAHRDNEVRTVLAPLAKLAEEFKLAVLIVCHTRKSTADFADDAVLGSRAFTVLSRSVWHLSDDAEDRKRKLFLPGKCNLAVSPSGLAFRIVTQANGTGGCEWEPDALDTHADDVVGLPKRDRSTGPEPVKRNAAKEWLAELMANGPMYSDDVKRNSTEAGQSWSTVRRASEGLGVVYFKQSFSGRWAWRLPGQEPEQLGEEPRSCPSGIEPEHLGQNTVQDTAKPIAITEDAHVATDLGNLAYAAQDAHALNRGETAKVVDPWNDLDQTYAALKAAGVNWLEAMKWLQAPTTFGFYQVPEDQRRRAYLHFTRKK